MVQKKPDFVSIKNKAMNVYKKIDKIHSPAFKKPIKISSDGRRHIERKDSKHKRNTDQAAMRYLCFLSLKEILEKSRLYQEYKAGTQEVTIKKHNKRVKEKRMVQYYGFVAVIKHRDDRHRIRVVVKEVHGSKNIEFLSVMPARKMKGYTSWFGPEK